MNNKVGAFCSLLQFIHNDHSRWARDRTVNHQQRQLYDKVSKGYRPVEVMRLNVTIREAKAGRVFLLSQKEGFLFLRPPEKDRVLLPVIGLEGDFNKPEIKIRMALFTIDKRGQLAAIGFRFERGEGRHSYHHAQFIKTLAAGDLPGAPEWLPERQPAFLMSARNPFSLFLGVLTGLYGFDYLEKVWPAGHLYREHLREDFQDLRTGCGAPSL